jgi:hypothetical protein
LAAKKEAFKTLLNKKRVPWIRKNLIHGGPEHSESYLGFESKPLLATSPILLEGVYAPPAKVNPHFWHLHVPTLNLFTALALQFWQ